ncbi:SUMF1/EgtB/PvdO family nonheme iron enzyme [Parabacteroides sp. PF5-9]|uniref:type IX secretion system lipoprotein PorK/GldK n=1 Tax=Parabacteroides sp. PF5-9 TaxID=1742404 RepID=UPI002473C679|nr:SUMF1/EgtB/PvdO family nonheme iron enzyme [Parabacteroides sp. PF5-9]MDH6358403.1 sulfatase modifying factor 1 [Parabacteroides sp. PF5-9]
MKKVLVVLVTMTLLTTSCGRSLSGAGGEVTGVRSVAFNEPSPYGMVLIKRGAFEMGPSDKDSLWGIMSDTKGVSFDAFWMDQTEVTNSKYRQFVHWVRDSIIRERLADPAYGGNDLFKITEDRYGEPVTPHLDWSRPIPWRRPSEDEQLAIESVYYTNPVTGEKKLDPQQMHYKYEWYDYTAAALRKHRFNPQERVRNTDIEVNMNEVIMISKDTAYIDEEGRVVNETITRPLSSEWDFLHTRIINIYPDESSWVNDFNNAYNEPYMRMYFNHPGYDDYPVVGVSWEMATAFCVWRTNLYKESLTLSPGQTIEPFRLPTEGEWEYAARAGKNENKYPWATDELQNSKGCFLGNFKPGDGNYTEDGHLITSRVGSFSANEFGLFDMAGNVAEWTSTSYAESGPNQMSDMNPELHYDAAKEDPYAMKKKTVRGGSWKDVAQFIRSDMRTFEYQNETRSYIGFRCARTQIGFSKGKK